MKSINGLIRASTDHCHSSRPRGLAFPRLSFSSVVLFCLVLLSVALPAAGQVDILQCPVTTPFPTLCAWDDPSVWSNGVPNGTTDISLPDGFVLVNINAANGHILDFAAPAHLFTQSSIQFANSGRSAVINNSGSFVNNGVLFNQLGATLNNLNQLTNTGIMDNRTLRDLRQFRLRHL